MQQPQILNSPKMLSALNQHRLAVALKFSIIVAVIVAFYFQDLSMVFKGAITDESTYHILAIPPLFGYLVYRKRKMINASLQPLEAGKSFFQKNFSMLAGFPYALLPYSPTGMQAIPSRR